MQHEGRRGLLNALACVVAGRTDPAVEILRRTFPGEDALLDAAAATAHDYDDTHLRTVIHATPPVAGAVLSLSRRRPVAGKDVLHAFVLGLGLLWWVGLAPALRTLGQAPEKHVRLDRELAQMQSLAGQAEVVRSQNATPTPARAVAVSALSCGACRRR